jgi:hypothetical protein
MPTKHIYRKTLTVNDQTPSHRPPPELYAMDHVPPNRTRAVIAGPILSAFGLTHITQRKLTSTTAPLYFAPGFWFGVGVVSLSIAIVSNLVVSIVRHELT